MCGAALDASGVAADFLFATAAGRPASLATYEQLERIEEAIPTTIADAARPGRGSNSG